MVVFGKPLARGHSGQADLLRARIVAVRYGGEHRKLGKLPGRSQVGHAGDRPRPDDQRPEVEARVPGRNGPLRPAGSLVVHGHHQQQRGTARVGVQAGDVARPGAQLVCVGPKLDLDDDSGHQVEGYSDLAQRPPR